MTNSNKIVINTLLNGKRISTQDLLQQIYKRLSEGFTEFEIEASGQHNIGGPLWDETDKELIFKIKNPGQRVGSMGMPGTTVVVEGSAPADVGWLNSGAEIIVKGDGGDTSGHCAASGKIYIGGRVGTRSGALMKHDPKFPPPEFWVLKNTGSFSFEFMGGGVAVVCGYNCDDIDSVIGNRSCIGMVGGTVYVRGDIKGLSDEVWVLDLDQSDKDFLQEGLKKFLLKIDKQEILKELTIFDQWKKIIPKTFEERNIRNLMPAKEFRLNKWIKDGIFGDLIHDDYDVFCFVETGDKRLKYPEWHNAAYSAPCEYNCPVYIPTQKRISLLREGKNEEALKMVLQYSPFPASVCGQVCPNLCIDDCNRKYIDLPVKTKELGLLSKNIKVDKPTNSIDKKIAIIGSGAAGLTAAWHLRKTGYAVDVYEEDSIIGGKLKQVIPEERLEREILDNEIKRISDIGVNFIAGKKVDKDTFAKIEKDYNAIVIAIGAHVPVVLPIEGHQLLIKGLDYLKDLNKSAINNTIPKFKIGKKVVVIGAGNAAMDVVIGAYSQGAEEVTAIDIQKPAAFPKEIEHAKKLGAKILWPCYTEKITKDGVYLKDGSFLPADTVIISVGDRSDFSMLGSNSLDEKGKARINEFSQLESNNKIFVVGDATKLGLFTHAIGEGRKVALNIDNMLSGKQLDKFEKAPMIPQDRVKSEFYPQINPQRVIEMSTDDEATRCMSCGTCRDCGFCKDICPEQAISRIQYDDHFEYISDSNKCIGCGICAGVCPCGIWIMQDNLEKFQEA